LQEIRTLAGPLLDELVRILLPSQRRNWPAVLGSVTADRRCAEPGGLECCPVVGLDAEFAGDVRIVVHPERRRHTEDQLLLQDAGAVAGVHVTVEQARY